MSDFPVTVSIETSAEHDFICLEININDREHLCKILVEVALGKSRHAMKIMAGRSRFDDKTLKEKAILSAEKLFHRQEDDTPYHRDGWMFQVVSWIASQVSYPSAIHEIPHIRHADKGLDGLCVAFDEQATGIAFCVVSEDKATTNPRGTFQGKVIPELETFESGLETSILTNGIISLIDNSAITDKDEAVETILWNDGMRYRVSITTGSEYHRTPKGKASLFEGFSSAVIGDDDRRIGVLMHDNNFRSTFDQIAARCLEMLGEREETDV